MYYSSQPELFIYDVAVRQDLQRKGLGKRMFLYLNDYCVQQGIKTMFVAANEEDAHAIEFYHSTGGQAENVVHFNYNF